jgi:hypothetical protein
MTVWVVHKQCQPPQLPAGGAGGVPEPSQLAACSTHRVVTCEAASSTSTTARGCIARAELGQGACLQGGWFGVGLSLAMQCTAVQDTLGRVDHTLLVGVVHSCVTRRQPPPGWSLRPACNWLAAPPMGELLVWRAPPLAPQPGDNSNGLGVFQTC